MGLRIYSAVVNVTSGWKKQGRSTEYHQGNTNEAGMICQPLDKYNERGSPEALDCRLHAVKS